MMASPKPESERMSEEARRAQDNESAERWRDSRATLVAIACTLRQDSLLQVAFHAFRELLWQRRLRSEDVLRFAHGTRGERSARPTAARARPATT